MRCALAELNYLISSKGLDGLKDFIYKYVDNCRDFVFDNDETLLHVVSHTYETARYLIVFKNCDVNALDYDDIPPLYYQRKGAVIKLMIEQGANMDIRPHGMDLFFGCSKDFDGMKYLVEEHNMNPFKFPQYPYNPIVSIRGYNYLLSYEGVVLFNYYNYNTRNDYFLYNEDGEITEIYEPSKLCYSGIALVKDVVVLHWIFSKYSDNLKEIINTKNLFSENALYHVRSPIIMEELLKGGCNPNCINIVGFNLLMYHRDLSLIKVLLKYGANVNWRIRLLDLVGGPYRKCKLSKYEFYELGLTGYINVCEYHKYTGNITVYKFLRRYVPCLLIQKNWRRYINQKKYVPESNKVIKVEYMEELKCMPPDAITKFLGGTEYQKGLESYMGNLMSE